MLASLWKCTNDHRGEHLRFLRRGLEDDVHMFLVGSASYSCNRPSGALCNHVHNQRLWDVTRTRKQALEANFGLSSRDSF